MSKNIVRYLALCVGILSISASYAYTSTDCSTVESLANRGFVSYKSNCRDYNLDKTISRQEVAAVALKVAESCGTIQNTPPVGDFYCANIFRDVTNNSPNTWACRAIETLANANIVSQNNAYFRPIGNITRAEALVIILDSAGLPAQSASYDDWRFTNSDAVNWQKPIIQYAYDNGIISTIGGFSANRYAYRSEIFNYAQKALDRCANGNTYTYNNNYSNSACAVGQYASGSSCYSCTGAPWNGRYTTRGTCDWTCNTGYYKSGTQCIANNSNNNYYGNNGQCGSTINSCISGTFYDTVDTGSYAYWNCTGTNGVAVSCSAYNNNNYYGNNGQCSTIRNTCTTGYPTGLYDSGSYSYWNCTGTSGTAVSCSSYNNNNYAGQCGLGYRWINNGCSSCNTKPNNSSYIASDSCEYVCNYGYTRDSAGFCTSNSYNNAQCGSTINSCISGTFYDTTDSGNYAYWNCMGSNGNTVSCNAYNNNNYYGNNGQCSTIRNTCTVGYPTGVYDSGSYSYWNCTGTNGIAVSCNTYNNNNYYGTTAQCGSTVNSCISGTFYDTTDSGSYAYWNCMGSNGNTVSCNAYNNNYYGYTTSGQCGTTRNSCITGTFVEVTDSVGYYNWYCNGTNGGYDQFCSVSTTYNNNYNTTPCCDKPKPLYNSYYTNNNGCWACNAGYRLSSDGYSCVY